jgi:hypothetical protein
MDKEEVPNVGKKREEEETGIPLESVISSLNFNDVVTDRQGRLHWCLWLDMGQVIFETISV